MNDHREESSPEAGLPWRVIGWSIAVGILFLPLIAMHFTSEVPWTFRDFVFAGVLIGGVGLTFEFATRIAPDRVYLLGFSVTLAVTFLLVWINAAVGIIGAEDNDANALYAFVLLVGVLTGLVGQFRARAMVIATAATAFAQASVTAYALVAGLGLPGSPPIKLLALNGIFIGGWLCAAVLFCLSARQQSAETVS